MRVDAWQEALEREFAQARDRRFRWGVHDCCQFAARCAKAVTGRDRRYRFPRYRNEAEALKLIAKFTDMQGLLTRAFGDPVHPSRANDGDIVLIDMGRGLQPAVCRGLECFAPGARHLEHRRTLDAVAAWNI